MRTLLLFVMVCAAVVCGYMASVVVPPNRLPGLGTPDLRPARLPVVGETWRHKDYPTDSPHRAVVRAVNENTIMYDFGGRVNMDTVSSFVRRFDPDQARP